IGLVFFLLLTTAALTSMIALLEIPVRVLTYRLRWSRGLSAAVMGAIIFLLGVPSALSYGVLDGMRFGELRVLDAIDHGVSNIMLPVIGTGTALFVGWRVE